MAFSIFFSLTVILAVSFALTQKNLHPFEILFMWMVTTIIHHTFVTITAVNLKLMDFAHHPENYWALVFNRVFLIPLLIIWYFDAMVARRPYQKWLWLPLAILILSGGEYLSEWLGLYTYTRWKLWWSLIEWSVILLLIHFSWMWYRSLLKKEENSNVTLSAETV
jgi:Kef-type K+ transport system membrane component KefB